MRGYLGFIAAIAAAMAMLAFAGCGDDEGDANPSVNGSAASDTSSSKPEASGGDSESPDTESTGDGTITKAEFVKQANDVCQKYIEEVGVKGEEVFQEVFSKPQAVGAKRLANEVIIPAFEGELEDLRALDIPQEDSAQINAIYKAIEDMVNRVKADPEVEKFYPYKEAEKLAADYGLKNCGHP